MAVSESEAQGGGRIRALAGAGRLVGRLPSGGGRRHSAAAGAAQRCSPNRAGLTVQRAGAVGEVPQLSGAGVGLQQHARAPAPHAGAEGEQHEDE